jgi:hypothetical protein
MPPPETPSTKPEPLDCGRIPSTIGASYWEKHAEPPATCRQADAVLRTAVDQTRNGHDATVDGWRCESMMSGGAWDTTCTKGGLTLYTKFVYVP